MSVSQHKKIQLQEKNNKKWFSLVLRKKLQLLTNDSNNNHSRNKRFHHDKKISIGVFITVLLTKEQIRVVALHNKDVD